jgi:putative endonuclease
MTDWHVYIIRCANGTLYTGITTDVSRRFQEHNEMRNRKGSKYLKGKGPLTLAWQHPAQDRSHASKLEYTIKRMNKADKERLVNGELSLKE